MAVAYGTSIFSTGEKAMIVAIVCGLTYGKSYETHAFQNRYVSGHLGHVEHAASEGLELVPSSNATDFEAVYMAGISLPGL